MSGTQVGGVWIELYDRQGNISRNANRGVNTVDISLNDADLKVARAMAIDPKSVAMLKYKHGKGGLAGVALFADDGRASSPFPPAGKFKPTNPGKITDDGGVPVRTVVEPEDSDSDDLPGIGRPVRTIGLTFPDGSTSASRRAASDDDVDRDENLREAVREADREKEERKKMKTLPARDALHRETPEESLPPGPAGANLLGQTRRRKRVGRELFPRALVPAILNR